VNILKIKYEYYVHHWPNNGMCRDVTVVGQSTGSISNNGGF